MYVQPSSYNLPPKYTTASYASLWYKLFQALSGSLNLISLSLISFLLISFGDMFLNKLFGVILSP